MKTHKLKTWPEYFSAIKSGVKTFEVRENDRGFDVGDVLILKEFIPCNDTRCEVHTHLMPDGKCTCMKVGDYTGKSVKAKITYITDFGQPDNQVVMAIALKQSRKRKKSQ